MHLTRAQTSKKIPIARKGTKYVVRAMSYYRDGIPALIAVRDILKLARTAREVKEMIKLKLIKINGKVVKDYRESLRLFNIFEADKKYILTLLPTKRFHLEEFKGEERLCKVINKKVMPAGKIQINFHDGSNILSDDKIKVGDSVTLDNSGKIKKKIVLERGAKVFISSGKNTGKKGVVEEIKDRKAIIQMEDKKVELDKDHFIVI